LDDLRETSRRPDARGEVEPRPRQLIPAVERPVSLGEAAPFVVAQEGSRVAAQGVVGNLDQVRCHSASSHTLAYAPIFSTWAMSRWYISCPASVALSPTISSSRRARVMATFVRRVSERKPIWPSGFDLTNEMRTA